ncbi:MAG TPA: hypothetical protein VKB35_03130, partial [Ktedonobacteraceae bacterium]|nr:hypothetical protein [Ktedonobacteraceae bacterium]
MSRLLSNLPIFRRLFIAFAIAAVIPAVVIVLLGNFYLSSLTTRAQAVTTSFSAQTIAAQELQNLQTMNQELQTRFNEIFANLSGRVQDASLANAGGLIGSDIAARQANFGSALSGYQATYELATSANMSDIRSILVNDQPATGPGIISDQQTFLDHVANNTWPSYLALQKQAITKLDNLDPTTCQVNKCQNQISQIMLNPTLLANAYEDVYTTWWHTNASFTNLANDWQQVVNDTVSMGKTVIAVGASQTQPVLIAT